MTTMLAAGLRIRGLTKSYGPVGAVDGVDLDIVAGETVALLGPNGAGRSTTIDALLGLSRPDTEPAAHQTGTRNRVEALRVAETNGWL